MLTIFRGTARHYIGLPRLALAGGTLSWCGWIWWHSSLKGNPFAQPEFWWGWFTNLGHAPAFALVALGSMGVILKSQTRDQGLGLGSPLQVALSHGTPGRQTGLQLDRSAKLLVMGLTVCYGLIDELHQSFVYGRTASLWDVVTDGVGAASVLWISGYLLRPCASSRGLGLRLFLGTSACVLAALVATLTD